MNLVLIIPASAAAIGLVSCSAVSKVGQNSMALVRQTGRVTTSKVGQLTAAVTDKISPAGVKVVEVREKDLKKMQTGEERALAFEANRNRHVAQNKRSFWFFNGPVDFKEPTLPSSEGEMDGSLLPPKIH
jgi:hypothetical protein